VTSFLKVAPRLPVRDLQRAIDFYCGVLGFSVAGTWPDDTPTFVMLERDAVDLQFYVREDPTAEGPGAATLHFEVDDALAALESLDDRVEVEWGPEVYWYGRRELAVRDPDGHLVILSEATDEPVSCADNAAEGG